MLSNNMTKLLNKIERRLGTRQLNLPEHLSKDSWVDIIVDDSLSTFSRYFPNIIQYEVVVNRDKGKDGYCIIDENLFSGDVEILGVRDICWEQFSNNYSHNSNYGIYDYYNNYYGIEDIALIQARADIISLFDTGIYVDYKYPNKIRLTNSTGANLMNTFPTFKVDLLIKHSANLNTISPTKMEVFENLCIADIASFLYEELKYYDGMDTVYSNIDLKLSDLENKATKREEIISKLEESYVSSSNDNQPIRFTV